jgi:hypothetical protein
MPIHEPTIHDIVARFGGHTAAAFGIDLDDEAQLGRWLIAVCLTGARVDEERWQRAFAQLDRAGLADPDAIANPPGFQSLESPAPNTASVGVALEGALLEAEHPDAEPVARKLIRVSIALAEHYAGSLDRLASSADNLNELGGRLAALAPGFGAASVTRFLRPLRDRWAVANELPLHATAHAAAIHLGLVLDGDDPDHAPGTLRTAIAAPPPAFRDVEAALERLGVWCRRNRIKTCPLADSCPARTRN